MCAPLSLTATRCVAVDRVTNGSGTTRLPLAPVIANRFCPAGLIREKLWHGEGGMHELRTVKEPKQSLATFEETVKLLMRVSAPPRAATSPRV